MRDLDLVYKNIFFSVSPVWWLLAKGKDFRPPILGLSLFAAAFSPSYRDPAHEEEAGRLQHVRGKDSGTIGPH